MPYVPFDGALDDEEKHRGYVPFTGELDTPRTESRYPSSIPATQSAWDREQAASSIMAGVGETPPSPPELITPDPLSRPAPADYNWVTGSGRFGELSPERQAQEQARISYEGSRRNAARLGQGQEPGPVASALRTLDRKPLDQSLAGAAAEYAADAARGLAQTPGMLAEAAAGGVRLGAQAVGAEQVAGVAKGAADVAKETQAGLRSPSGDQTITGAFQSIGLMLAGGAAGGVAGSIGIMAGQQGLQAANEALDRGETPSNALAHGTAYGIAEWLGERIGMPGLAQYLTQSAKGGLRAAVTNFAKEQGRQIGEEELTQVLQSLQDKFGVGGGDPDMTLADFAQQALEVAKQTAVMTTVAGAGGTAQHALGRAVRALSGELPPIPSAEEVARSKGFLQPPGAPAAPAAPQTPPATPEAATAPPAPPVAPSRGRPDFKAALESAQADLVQEPVGPTQRVTYEEPADSLSRQAGLTPIVVDQHMPAEVPDQPATESEIAAPAAEPAQVWVGRSKKGFQTYADAAQAIEGRAMRFPDLTWRVEQTPTGTYRLAGYQEAAGDQGIGEAGAAVAARTTGVAGQAGVAETGRSTPVHRPAGREGENLAPPGAAPGSGQETAETRLSQAPDSRASRNKRLIDQIAQKRAQQEFQFDLGTRQPAVVINVGLATNDGKGITAGAVVNELRRRGISIVGSAVHESDTEPTFVARLSRPLTADEANALSAALKQEAIAQAVGNTGALYGPEAAKWGEFNPEFFLRLDGQRLSKPQVPELPAIANGRGVSMYGVHYSPTEGLSSLSPSRFGTGIKGAERERLSEPGVDQRLKRRVSLYPAKNESEQPQPEAGLGANVYRSKLNNIYDPRRSTARERDMIRALQKGSGENAYEAALIDAGYSGYFNPEQQQIVVFGKDVPVRAEGKIEASKVVPRVPERVSHANESRREGAYVVRKLNNEELRAFIRARKTVTGVAPSAKLEHGELRVKADEVNAANAAIAAEGGGLLLSMGDRSATRQVRQQRSAQREHPTRDRGRQGPEAGRGDRVQRAAPSRRAPAEAAPQARARPGQEAHAAVRVQTRGFRHQVPVDLTQVTRGPVTGEPALTKALNANNLADQERALDTLAVEHPDPLASPNSWSAFERKLTGDNQHPAPPYRAIRLASNMDRWATYFNRLTPHQIEGARRGLAAAERFKRLYESGQATPRTTAKLMLWGILSRMLSTHPHESAFLDANVNGKLNGFIDAALDHEMTAAEAAAYRRWSMNEVIPKYAPSKSATSNLNDFGGLFLRKMSTRLPDGRSALEHLHEMVAEHRIPSSEVRRWFYALAGDVGIKNKVLSFMLLMSGRTDVMVLDRIQINTMWDAGRYGRLIYDDFAPALEGAHGLARYEALERSLMARLPELYRRVGRPEDASVGRYHWESWVLNSGQIVSHPTITSLADETMGVGNPFHDIGAPEGRFHQYAFGSVYARDTKNRPYILYNSSDNSTYRFTLQAFKEFLKVVKAPSNGIVPSGFKVKDYAQIGYPWYQAPTVNRAKLDAAIRRFGRLDTQRTVSGVSEGTHPNVAGQGPRALSPNERLSIGNVTQSLRERFGVKPQSKDAQDIKDVELFQKALRARGLSGLVLHHVDLDVARSNGQLSQSSVDTLRNAERVVARLFNKRLIFFSSNQGVPNGAFSRKRPDVIFLNVHASRPRMAVLGHEMLHALRNSHPDIYDTLHQRLVDMGAMFDLYEKGANAEYTTRGMDPLLQSVAHEEFVADVTGDAWMDQAFWEELFAGQPKSFLREAGAAIMRFFDNVIERLTKSRPFGTDAFLEDFNMARQAVADAFRAMMRESGGFKETGQPLDLALPATQPQAEADIDTAIRMSLAGDLNFKQRDYNMTEPQLEQFLIFARMVAGKNAGQRAPVVEKLIDRVMTEHPGQSPIDAIKAMLSSGREAEMTAQLKQKWGEEKAHVAWRKEMRALSAQNSGKKGLQVQEPGPFTKMIGELGLAPWQDSLPFFQYLAEHPKLDLRTATPEEISQIPGISYKTAKFFAVHTRESARDAVLDTHILKWLAAQGYENVPESSPQNPKVYDKWEKVFQEEADKRGVTPSQLDMNIWLGKGELAEDTAVQPETQDAQIDDGIKLSISDYEPKKTVKAYKLFRTDGKGNLYPLFVDAKNTVPQDQWVRAIAGPMTGKKVKSKIGPLAYRPGWHAGDLPIATHIGEKAKSRDKKPSFRPADQVWAEIEMAADRDWQTEANRRGINAKGRLVNGKAHITDQVPVEGFYRYKTNSNMTGNWMIGGDMKVGRVLSDAEVKKINDAAGVADLPRREVKLSVADTDTPDINLSLGARYGTERDQFGREFIGRNVQSDKFAKSDLTPGAVKSEKFVTKMAEYVDSEYPIINAARKAGNDPVSVRWVRAVEALPGRVEDRTERESEQYTRPLVEQMGKSADALGMSADSLLDAYGLYRLARHAAERNATLRQNGSQKANPSGMSEAEASQWLQWFNSEPEMLAEFARLDPLLKAVQDRTDAIKLQAGLLTQEDIDARAGWNHYINLQGDPGVPTGSLKGGSWVDDNDKSAKGRDSLSANPVANTLASFELAISNAELARVKKATYAFARQHPDIVDAKITKLAAVPMHDENGRFIRAVPNADRWAESAVVYRVGDDEYHINFGDQQIADALRGLRRRSGIGVGMYWAGKGTRLMARMLTTWSPSFPFVNAIRDIQQQLTLIAGTNLKNDRGQPVSSFKVALKIVKSLPRAFVAAAKESFHKPDTSTRYGQFARELLANGGNTGLLKMLNDEKHLDSLVKQIQLEQSGYKHPIKQVTHAARELAYGISETFEMTNRIAVYAALRESGLGITQSVQFTKNLLNFNKAGTRVREGAAQLYMFVRPQITDTHRSLSMVLTKRGGAFFAGMIAAAVVAHLGLAIGSGDDDDDRKKRYYKHSGTERSMYIVLPNGSRIPVSYGPARWAWGLGSIIADSFMDRDQDAAQAAGRLMKVVSQNFTPIPISDIDPSRHFAEWAATTFTPSLAVPLRELSVNRTALGNKIRSDDEYDKRAAYTRGWPSTPQFWKMLARELYNHSNGNIDFTPEVLQHLFVRYTGSPGQNVANLLRAREKTLTGEGASAKDVPIVTAFVSPPDRSMERRARNIREIGADFERKYDDAKLHDHARLRELQQDKEGMLAMESKKRMDKISQHFSKAHKQMRELSMVDYEKSAKQNRQIDERQKAAVEQVVTHYNRELDKLRGAR